MHSLSLSLLEKLVYSPFTLTLMKRMKLIRKINSMFGDYVLLCLHSLLTNWNIMLHKLKMELKRDSTNTINNKLKFIFRWSAARLRIYEGRELSDCKPRMLEDLKKKKD